MREKDNLKNKLLVGKSFCLFREDSLRKTFMTLCNTWELEKVKINLNIY